METQVLTPHVYWAQRHRELYLRVELSDVQVKAGLRDARGIGPPHGCPSAALRVRAPAVRQREPRVGAPRSPLGLQVRSGVLRVAPRDPLCSWPAPRGAAAESGRPAAGLRVARGPLSCGMSPVGLKCGVTVACWTVAGCQRWPLRSNRGGPLTFSSPVAGLGGGQPPNRSVMEIYTPARQGNAFHPLCKAVSSAFTKSRKEIIVLN